MPVPLTLTGDVNFVAAVGAVKSPLPHECVRQKAQKRNCHERGHAAGSAVRDEVAQFSFAASSVTTFFSCPSSLKNALCRFQYTIKFCRDKVTTVKTAQKHMHVTTCPALHVLPPHHCQMFHLTTTGLLGHTVHAQWSWEPQSLGNPREPCWACRKWKKCGRQRCSRLLHFPAVHFF